MINHAMESDMQQGFVKDAGFENMLENPIKAKM